MTWLLLHSSYGIKPQVDFIELATILNVGKTQMKPPAFLRDWGRGASDLKIGVRFPTDNKNKMKKMVLSMTKA